MDEGDTETTNEEWLDIARQLPVDGDEIEDVETLGSRDVDLEYDWQSHGGTYPDLHVLEYNYWEQLKAHFEGNQDESISLDLPQSLNSEQHVAYNLFVSHYQQTLAGENPPPIRVNLDGHGGTGKSFLIQAISSMLNRLSPSNQSVVARAAPTGVAANAIGGSTLHLLLLLPVSRSIANLPPLSSNVMSVLRARLRFIKYFIIDEKSMIGLRTMCFIDRRLREIHLDHQDEPFGDCNVLLLGDFSQLPPVMEKPLYFDGSLYSEVDIMGRNAYRSINRIIELVRIIRQQGPEQAAFRRALEGLRNCRPFIEHWRLLCTRAQARLTLTEVATFDETLRIFPTNQMVRQYNLEHMEKLHALASPMSWFRASGLSRASCSVPRLTIPTSVLWAAELATVAPLIVPADSPSVSFFRHPVEAGVQVTGLKPSNLVQQVLNLYRNIISDFNISRGPRKELCIVV